LVGRLHDFSIDPSEDPEHNHDVASQTKELPKDDAQCGNFDHIYYQVDPGKQDRYHVVFRPF
jgi:hypothetical protein